MKVLPSSCVRLLVLIFCSAFSRAAFPVLEAVTLEELAARAELIIEAVVAAKSPKKKHVDFQMSDGSIIGGETIITEYVLHIESTLKGIFDRPAVVMNVEGGTLTDGNGLRTSMYFELEPGQRVVAFIKREPVNQLWWAVTGSGIGVFVVEPHCDGCEETVRSANRETVMPIDDATLEVLTPGIALSKARLLKAVHQSTEIE